MPEDLPVPASNGWFADWIANGKIPGATKAIAQLVGDTANAGSAWVSIATAKGEQIQQRIKADTAGSKLITDALSRAAAELGAADPAIVQSALKQLGSSAVRKHINRVEVLRHTADELNKGPEIVDEPSDIEDDWLNKFEGIAGDASSERIRKILAKILAGEIRKPGTFSFATLHFISILDTRIAEALNTVAPHVLARDFIPFPSRFDFTAVFDEILLLRNYGLISEHLVRRISVADDKRQMFAGPRTGFIVGEIQQQIIPLNLMPLTRVGREIFSLIEAPMSEVHIEDFVRCVFRDINCQWIDVCSVTLLENDQAKYMPIERHYRSAT